MNTSRYIKMAININNSIAIHLAIIIVLSAFVCAVDGRSVKSLLSIKDTPEPMRKCRVVCMKRFVPELDAHARALMPECRADKGCYMCWDFCEIMEYESLWFSYTICHSSVCVSLCNARFSAKPSPNIIMNFVLML